MYWHTRTTKKNSKLMTCIVWKCNVRSKGYFSQKMRKYKKRIFCYKVLKLEDIKKIYRWDSSIIGMNIKLNFLLRWALYEDLRLIKLMWMGVCKDKGIEIALGLKCWDFDSGDLKCFMQEVKIVRDLDCDRLSEEIMIKLYKHVADNNCGRFTRIVKIKKPKPKENRSVQKWCCKWLVDNAKAASKRGVKMKVKDLRDESSFLKFFSSLGSLKMSRVLLVGKKEIPLGVHVSADGRLDAFKVYRRTLLMLNYLVAKMRLKQRVSIVWVKGIHWFDWNIAGLANFNKKR